MYITATRPTFVKHQLTLIHTLPFRKTATPLQECKTLDLPQSGGILNAEERVGVSPGDTDDVAKSRDVNSYCRRRRQPRQGREREECCKESHLALVCL